MPLLSSVEETRQQMNRARILVVTKLYDGIGPAVPACNLTRSGNRRRHPDDVVQGLWWSVSEILVRPNWPGTAGSAGSVDVRYRDADRAGRASAGPSSRGFPFCRREVWRCRARPTPASHSEATFRRPDRRRRSLPKTRMRLFGTPFSSFV